MKKIICIVLATLVLVALTTATTKAGTFDPPNTVHVSGDAHGTIYCKSNYPAALDIIDGASQYRNDIQKRNGTGQNRMAYREAVRVSPNLLTISLYQSTLRRQFSFNFRSGSLWGQIPSCHFIPDGITVIMEDSYPISKREEKDSEDGQGGMHFSLIAHLTAAGLDLSKEVNPVPFDASACDGGGYATQPAPAAPGYTQAPGKHHAHKAVPAATADNPLGCDPCEKDTNLTVHEIDNNVGKATPEEVKAGLGTVHKKESHIIKSLGVPKPKPGQPVLSMHEKTGEPTKPGDTLFSGIDKGNQKLDEVLKRMPPAVTTHTLGANPPLNKEGPEGDIHVPGIKSPKKVPDILKVKPAEWSWSNIDWLPTLWLFLVIGLLIALLWAIIWALRLKKKRGSI